MVRFEISFQEYAGILRTRFFPGAEQGPEDTLGNDRTAVFGDKYDMRLKPKHGMRTCAVRRASAHGTCVRRSGVIDSGVC